MYPVVTLSHQDGHYSAVALLLKAALIQVSDDRLPRVSGFNFFPMMELTNPLARRPGLVISTFGLAEIISCMPDGLVKIYIGY